jgi:hypothetical protein
MRLAGAGAVADLGALGSGAVGPRARRLGAGSRGSAEARAALSSRAAVESDESVMSELAAALGPSPFSAKNFGSYGAVRSTTSADLTFARFMPGMGSTMIWTW